MGMFKKDNTDAAKVKPQPYESFEEAEQKREQDATAVNPPLTEQQKAIVRQQAGVNPVSQTMSDVLKDRPDLPAGSKD
ncbi:MAG: cytochrome-c oxidase [Neisseria sp.]|nr:cytochrome-c oxidase [Neisseria sp.]